MVRLKKKIVSNFKNYLEGLDTLDDDPLICSILLLFFLVFFLSTFNVLVHSKSLNKSPQITMFKNTPDNIIVAPRHPLNSLTRYCVSGAKIKVPTPDPHTEMPVANDRLASK